MHRAPANLMTTGVNEMVRTHGLTHISLAVHNPERSLQFYSDVFGVREYFRDDSGTSLY